MVVRYKHPVPVLPFAAKTIVVDKLHVSADAGVACLVSRVSVRDLAKLKAPIEGALAALVGGWHSLVVVLHEGATVDTKARWGDGPLVLDLAGRTLELGVYCENADERGFAVFATVKPGLVFLVEALVPYQVVMCTVLPASEGAGEITPIDCRPFVVEGKSTRLETLLAESMYACHQKVLAYAASRPPYTIDASFDAVYLTSDVHADLARFVRVLVATGLVEQRGDNVRWVAPNTMLVVCGDIVDGLRDRGGVLDDAGSSEFLLHVLLFNLRIQAHLRGSDVRFTLGNHDVHSVTVPRDDWTDKYTTPRHLYYAPKFRDVKVRGKLSSAPRAAMLQPFYLCSPYLLLRHGSAVFVHAGFWAGTPGENTYEAACAKQGQIDAERDAQRVLALTAVEDKKTDVRWVRGYAGATGAVCGASPAAHAGLGLVVVGHCVTHATKYVDLPYKEQCAGSTVADDDSDIGCVITHDCRAQGGPLIAMVDTGMSRCFRSAAARAENNARPIGMLLLHKDHSKGPMLGVVDEYAVYRIRVDTTARVVDPRGEPAFGRRFV